MFEKYPKVKLNLPKQYEEIFFKHYMENRNGKTFASYIIKKMESWMHRKVASDVKKFYKHMPTLEIGAGTLNHIPYERNIAPYDIIEPCDKLYKSSVWLSNVREIYQDISEIPADQKYERIISIATLEHITNLPETIAKVGLLLNRSGHFRTGISSEGTFLWKLGWKITSGLEFKLNYNLNYDIIRKYEHVSTADEIEEILNYFFVSVKRQVFGISGNISFYRFYNCSNPNIQRCLQFS